VNITGGEQSDVDWKRDVHRLTLIQPGAPRVAMTAGNEQLFLGNMIAENGRGLSPKERRERLHAERTYVLVFETNGTFRVDNVPPGEYQLTVNVTDPEDEYYNRRYIGTLNKQIKVPDEKNSKVNAPFDIGTLDLTIRPRVKVGNVVPSFEMKTASGKVIKPSDFRGKYLLLHFWGQSIGYNTTEFTVLKELNNTYGGTKGKLVIVGCNLDQEKQFDTDQFMRNYSMTWMQCFLGNWSQTPIPGMFGFNGNSGAALIDPEGKLVSTQLRSTSIRTAVRNALSASEFE
jgi:hypothetical protein